VVSSDTQLALDLQSELTSSTQPAQTRRPRLTVDIMDIDPQDAQTTRTLLNQQLASGDLDGYLWIAPAASPSLRPAFTFTPRSSEQDSLRSTLTAALGTVLMR